MTDSIDGVVINPGKNHRHRLKSVWSSKYTLRLEPHLICSRWKCDYLEANMNGKIHSDHIVDNMRVNEIAMTGPIKIAEAYKHLVETHQDELKASLPNPEGVRVEFTDEPLKLIPAVVKDGVIYPAEKEWQGSPGESLPVDRLLDPGQSKGYPAIKAFTERAEAIIESNRKAFEEEALRAFGGTHKHFYRLLDPKQAPKYLLNPSMQYYVCLQCGSLVWVSRSWAGILLRGGEWIRSHPISRSRLKMVEPGFIYGGFDSQFRSRPLREYTLTWGKVTWEQKFFVSKDWRHES